MSLSEGKMFTIEELNRIEGFVWPNGAAFAFMPKDSKCVVICESQPVFNGFMNLLPQIIFEHQDVKVTHPDWWHSVITREEFESVDGWVRNNFIFTKINSLIDVTIKSKGDDYVIDGSCDNWTPEWESGDIVKWRYHKPQKQEVKPEPENNTSDQSAGHEGIESLISKHKAVKEIARLARIALEQAEAAEHSLMLSIEAWAEGHGFDIRVLSESEEKPELVITDWRDVQIGDAIECIEPVGGEISPGDVGVVTYVGNGAITADFHKQSDYVYGGCHFGSKWKIIISKDKK